MANTITENANEILERSIIQLRDNTQITRLTPGSKARTLLGIIASELERMGEVLTSNMVLGLVNGSSGVYLDFLGELVGVERGRRLAAKTSVGEQNLRISCPAGLTFGDLNAGLSISIPAGTQISSSDGSIRFVTTGLTVLLPENDEQFAGIRSVKFGQGANVAAGTLTVLSFEGYATSNTLKLSATNLSSIETGQDEESDDFYRYRISNALLTAESGNATAIRLAALSVQSVSDVAILNNYRGPGTADLILDTVNGSVPPLTIESVYRAILPTTSLGMDIRVRAPELLGLELSLDVVYVRGLSTAEKATIDSNIRASVQDLIASIPMGGSLQINSLSTRIFNSDKRIADLGVPNKPITELIIWRKSALTGGRRATPYSNLNTNIALEIDERLTLEDSPKKAIKIREK